MRASKNAPDEMGPGDERLAETVLAEIEQGGAERRRPGVEPGERRNAPGIGKGTHAAVAEIELRAEHEPILRYVALGAIERNPKQPRKTFDPMKMEELAQSIREGGIRQPLLLARKPGGRFVIVAGERRWRAAHMVGLARVPAMIVDADEADLAIDSLVENVQRVNLTDLEEAESFLALHNEFGLTHDEIARKLGKSRTFVTNRISTYSKLTPRTKEIILEVSLSNSQREPEPPPQPRKRGRPPKSAQAAIQAALPFGDGQSAPTDTSENSSTRVTSVSADRDKDKTIRFGATINRLLATLPAEQQEEAALHLAATTYTTRQAEEWLKRGNMCNEGDDVVFTVRPVEKPYPPQRAAEGRREGMQTGKKPGPNGGANEPAPPPKIAVTRLTLIFASRTAERALAEAIAGLPEGVRRDITVAKE